MQAPKQEPKRKEKKKTKAQQVSQTKTNEQLAELIKDALAVQFKKQVKRNKIQNELDAMAATCEEFMNSFIILGYDLDGNPVEPIVVAHSQQEADSLGSYLNKFISSQIHRNGS